MRRARPQVGPVRRALRRSLLRQRLHAAASGSLEAVGVDLGDRELDACSLLCEVASPLRAGSMPLLGLSSALAASGSLARIVDGLADADPARREDAVRAVGALRLEAAVPWLRTLLGANESRVRLRAARALGRIGGVRGADALVAALRARRIPVNRLVIELARAAPDLYIETMLVDPRQAGIRASLVAAAGLRRRRGSLTALRQLAGSGTERERVAACSALWRLRDAASPAAIGPALEHRSWRVRRAACRALGQLGDRTHLPELYRGLNDPHPKARIAAARALRRLGEAIQA